MITAIEDYFTKGCGRYARFDTPDCSTRLWAEGLAVLRGLCLGAGLDETLKWGHPGSTHAGRNIVVMGAFHSDFRLTFMDAALLQDPEGVLTSGGPNTPHPNTIRFTGVDQVSSLAPTLSAYLA